MTDLLSYIVKNIVKNPNDVSIEIITDNEMETVFNIIVNESDIGLVIGKEGKTIRAINNALKYNIPRKRIVLKVNNT